VDSSHPAGPALVAAAADADPVTLLVLGWLAANRSENTRTAYARDIGITPPRRPSRAPSWLTWCQEQGVHPVTGVTMLHVTRYARQLDTAGLSPASAARKLAAISSWYDWLARRGHITASPAVGIARPRPGPRTPPAPALTPDQALALLHAADTAPGPQRARTAALIAVLLYTSARLGEVTGADVADLGTSGGRRVLWVTRGSGRRQGLPLPGPAASRIDAYLAGRAGQAPVQALFVTRTGRRLFAADVRQTVSRIAARAGLPADQARHLGPRMIRRSFTTLYLQASESLRGLHSSPGQPGPPAARRYEQARHTLASHTHPAAPRPRKPPSQLHPGDQARDPDPESWPQSRPHCGAGRPQHAARHTRPRLSRASSGGRIARARPALRRIVEGRGELLLSLDRPGPGVRAPWLSTPALLVDPPHTRHTGAAPGMRALCTRRLAWPGLLPGLMRLAGAASVILTSPSLRAAEVRITPAQLQETDQPGSKVARARVTPGA
jgi:site-specific recombinase XerC